MGRLGALSREQGDMLLPLLAAAMALAPHVLHLPPPLSLAMACLLLWRATIIVRGQRQPSLWLLAPLALAGIAAVAASYGSVLGRDPGVAMLALLLALKSLEMRSRRDVQVVVFLSFFLLLASFFHHQGLLGAVWMLATVLALLATLLSSRYGKALPPLRQRFWLLARMLALALPLAALLFFAMPRVQGPLWGKPDAAGASGVSGLGASMRPGAIASLALSDATVFTARFATPLPTQQTLYWRGVVLDDFDGAAWRRSAASDTAGAIDIVQSGAVSNYEVQLAASGQPRIFALDLPRSVERLTGNPYLVSPALEITTLHPITTLVRYRASSLSTYRLQPTLSPQQLQPWLQLPAGFNPRSLAWARRLRGSGTHQLTPPQAIDAVLAHFHQATFRYTLQPPLLGRHSVDNFLFGTRAGFCEHYASSFTVLMRAMGIPARIVTGYQGGSREADGATVTVRQRDAHAWSEVWLAGQGWVRVDPTGAVAPLRIERGLTTALPEAAPAQANWRTLIGLGADGGAFSTFGAWQQRWQQAERGWRHWIVDATPQRQRDLWARLASLPVRTVALLCAMLTSVAALGVLLWLRQPALTPPDQLDALYARFCALQARRGHSRAPHEGPHGYAARLAASPATPEMSDTHAAIARFLAIYAAIKYGNASPDEHRRARRSLRRLLNQCR
ncbi:transglutaminase TgpA family protein [Janthinobacterium aquaticum]|uniref:transglutaminase TgpA family protein n=1 Tax=Janthinobacterium sp. FT58W TaxID=2654254 RepID=UPI0012642ED2|nr:DUF3488 and transglutaminase-like domain-containing protein [Janthinobacterium sp. FT58W]KAB8041507.1 DUF3488 domain-containing protein [Janthinobacterium sp. FT58W]